MKDQDATSPATVAEADLVKGLARLEQLAKGQITGKLPGNSEPKGRWARGAEPDEVTDEDSDISDDSDGDERSGKRSDTDYKPKSAPVQKAMPGKDAADGDGDDDSGDGDDEADDDAPEDDAEDGDDDSSGDGGVEPFIDARDDAGDKADTPDKKADKPPAKDVDKSLAQRARSSRHIRSGVEVSPFLRDLVRSLSKSQFGLERRVLRELGAAIAKSSARQRTFNRALADVVSGLGAVALEQGEMLKALGARPARGIKSQTHAVRPVEKSFGTPDGDTVTLGDGTTLPQLDRAVVMQRLLAGVEKGLIGPTEVVKFETTGIISPHLYKSLVTDERHAR